MLTCAVIETPDVKVVVDESRLEPSVVQLPPFEVIGGQHAADLRNGDRRFFQYEYRLRLIAENLFGKDVLLPETKLSYRVQSRLAQRQSSGQGKTSRSRARSARTSSRRSPSACSSLVPADASDIRDAGTETFGDVDRRSFRANLLTVIGGVLFALAVLVALLAIVRLIMRTRKPASAAERLVGDGAILRGVGRELAAVQRQREDGGWTPELASRALSALRIVGTYAMGRRAARAEIVTVPAHGVTSPNGAMSDGRIMVRAGWPKTKNVAISGAVTARSIADAIAHPTNGRRPGELESIEEALSRFTVAQYSRPGNDGKSTLDDGALDESMRAGQDVLRRLKIEQTWLMRKLKRRRRAVHTETRVWSR